MARRRKSNRRRRGSFGFLYKLLSVLVICGAIVAALTLFFRVDTVVITGQQRYTEEEIREASGIAEGANLVLFNKYTAANNIVSALPYIEEISINRKLPDTLLIQVRECSMPLAVGAGRHRMAGQPLGKDRGSAETQRRRNMPTIDGCRLLAPSVGTQIALDSDYETQRQSLLKLLAALEEAGKLGEVNAIHLGDLSCISMDYMDRFTVKLDYDADFAYELQLLEMSIASDKIQDNMTGTFDMRQREDGSIHFRQNVRG